MKLNRSLTGCKVTRQFHILDECGLAKSGNLTIKNRLEAIIKSQRNGL